MYEKYIQIRIKDKDFSDAIYFTESEFAKLKEKEIQKMVSDRKTAWENKVVEMSNYEPTEEDLIAERERLQEQMAEVDSVLAIKTKSDGR